MNINRRQTMLIGAGLCVAMTFAGTASAADLKIRMSTESQPGASTTVMLEAFRDALTEEFGDAIEIEFYSGGQLGDEIVHMEQVRTGQLDINPIASDAVQLDSKWAIFEAPFLFPNFDKVHEVLDGPVGEEMRASMRESAGLEVLGLGDVGFRHITNNIRPIVKPEDLQGLKMRVPGSKARILAFEHLGAVPVTMNMGELYLALQQGTMDGQENPLQSVLSRSLEEVQKYLSLSAHVFTPTTLAMNGARWDGLTDDQKAKFKRAAAKAVAVSREYSMKADIEGREELASSMEVNEIDLPAFQAAARPIWDEIAKMAGEEFSARVISAATGN